MINNSVRTRIASIIILTNLIIGNGFLLVSGKSSFSEDVNLFLMTGMSIACIIFYSLFFKYSNFETFGNFKLILISILSCMVILFMGNAIAILIKEPISEAISNIPVAVLMGIIGNMVFFPVLLAIGLLNFGLIAYLKTKE